MSGEGFTKSVPCAGCDKPTPYDVGEAASFGEHLETPLGLCYRRTHRRRECVVASRAAVDGRPVKLGPPREERGLAAPQSAHPGPASCAATPAVMDAGRLPHPPAAGRAGVSRT